MDFQRNRFPACLPKRAYLRTTFLIILIWVPRLYPVAKQEPPPAKELSYTIQDSHNATRFACVRLFFMRARSYLRQFENGNSIPFMRFTGEFGVVPSSAAWDTLVNWIPRMLDSAPLPFQLTQDDFATLGYDGFMEKQVENHKAIVLSWQRNYRAFIRDYQNSGGDVARLNDFIDTWAKSRVKMLSTDPPTHPWNQKLIEIEKLFDVN